jgi:hypothetical protein
MDTVKFYDLANQDFLAIMWRFAINLVSLFILVRLIYFKFSGKEKFLFGFFLMGILTFFITSVLNSVFIQMAGAFGLFAVLGIMRMRTSNFSIKDMSYIFATLGLSVINAIKIVKFPILGMFIINALILLSVYLLELYTSKLKTETFSIDYENLEMLRPDRKEKLLHDLSELTGKQVFKVKIRKIDYKKSVSTLEISCRDYS